MATRSRTQLFTSYRNTLRTHKRGPRTNMELKEFKVHKNLLAAQSDDEGSTVDARVYSVPPVWVTMVDDMNRDISQIKIKSARARAVLACRAARASPTRRALALRARAVSELSTMSGKALLPGFADDDDQEDQIKCTEADITALFRECERRLKEMGRTEADGSADEVGGPPLAPRPRHPRAAVWPCDAWRAPVPRCGAAERAEEH